MASKFGFTPQSETHFDSTPFGVAVNTVFGLPKATVDVAKTIGRSITRNIASAGVTLAEPVGGVEELNPKDIQGIQGKIFRKVFGAEPIRTIQDRIAETEIDIQRNPTAQKLGLDKIALPLAFGGILGDTALDLTPLVGSKASIKQLIKISTSRDAIQILTKNGIPADVAQEFAPRIVKAKNQDQVIETVKLLNASAGSKLLGDLAKPDDAVSRLIKAVKEAGAPREELEAAYTAERARRATKLEDVFANEKGVEGYYDALRNLKGSLADTADFTLTKLDINDVDELFNIAAKNKHLDVFDKVTVQTSLQKMIEGKIPTKSELALLEEVYGRDLVKAVLSKRGILPKIGDAITEAINIPRTIMTSFDMSAPLRQGVLFTTKPVAFTKALGQMFRQAFSPKNFNEWLDDLPNHPNFEQMRQGKLYIADPRNVSGGLAGKEEAFMSNIAQNIPFLGGVIRASERSFVGFLNKLRTDVFTQMVNTIGSKKQLTKKDLISIADFVNHATGRGTLGGFERSAQALNTTFFSPRLIASRFNLALNPAWYAKQTKEVRREALKTMGKFVGMGMSILAIAKGGGADVEIDPRSTDFGKIRVGNTRWDIWGGFQQWARVFAQIAAGEKKTSGGRIIDLKDPKFGGQTRKDVAQRFIEGKLAPVPSLGLELFQGQNMFGEKPTIKTAAYENLVPLYFQDIKEVIDEDGVEGLFTAGIPAFFGVGVSSYGNNKKSTSKKNDGSKKFGF